MNRLLLTVLFFCALVLSLAACLPATPAGAPVLATDTPTAATSTPVSTPTELPASAPLTVTVLATWDINMPQNLAFGFDSVWVPSHRDPNVTTRIDPVSNMVSATIEGTGYRSHGALIVGNSVWVTGERDDLSEVDPTTNKVVAKVKGRHPYIAYGFDSLWGTTPEDRLDRIDLSTKEVTASIELGDGYVDCNNDVMATTSAVWVDHCDEQELIKIDPTTNTIISKTQYKQLITEAQARKQVPAGKGTDFIWRTLPSGLLRMDPNTGAGLTFLPLQPKQVGDGWVTVTDDAIWLSGDGQIERVNVATNQIDATYHVLPSRTHVGIGFGSVWVAYEFASVVQRLDIAP